jgi:hypothetical protein
MLLVMPLEAWVLSAILTLVGLLIVACGLGDIDCSVPFKVVGAGMVGVGCLTWAIKFWQWIHSL